MQNPLLSTKTGGFFRFSPEKYHAMFWKRQPGTAVAAWPVMRKTAASDTLYLLLNSRLMVFFTPVSTVNSRGVVLEATYFLGINCVSFNDMG